MKRNESIFLFLICLFSGLAYNSLPVFNKNIAVRSPSSVKGTLANCNSAIQSFQHGTDKAERLQQLKQAKRDNDFSTFAELIRDSHDNKEITKGQNPKGFSETRQRSIELLMSRTNNNYVTAYYQHYEPGDKNTWGIFNYVTEGEDLASEEGLLVLEKVMKWHSEYTNYRVRLEKQVLKSFENKMQYDAAFEHFNKNKKAIKDFNFRNGNRYFMILPTIVKNEQDGLYEVVKIKQGFSSLTNFKNYLKDAKKLMETSFAENSLEESMQVSEIYTIIHDQAFLRRRMEFIRDRLADVPTTKLSNDQREILEKFDDALHRSDLMPRSDAIKYQQKKEFTSELKAFFKGQKSRRKVLDTFRSNLMKKFGDGVKEQSQYFTYIKANLWGSVIISSTTLLVGTAGLLVTDNDYVLYYTSLLTNWFNEFLLETFGTTSTLNSCAKENREFSVENVCLQKFLFAHLSNYMYESRLEGNKDYTTNEDFIKRREELITIFFKKRDRLGNAEFFSENMGMLKEEGYKHYTAITFMELLEVKNGDLDIGYNPTAKADIYDYLTGSSKDEAKTRKNIEMKVGPALMTFLDEAKEELPSFALKVEKEGGASEDLRKFIEDSDI